MAGLNEALTKLLAESWNEYDRLGDDGYIVRPAIPVLFFGDSTRYFSSSLRVATVGLNPSDAEFPEPQGFCRFMPKNGRITQTGFRDPQQHLDALNSYFRCCPYTGWFSSFEPILKGMGSSFYDQSENTALHTDICSPIATRPTWSRLSREQRSRMEPEGNALWHSLIRILRPHVLLVSVAQRYLQKINFRAETDRELLWKVDRANPYEVFATVVELEPGQSSLLVFGKAAQTPFGKISNFCKRELGTAILGRLPLPTSR